jgi:hypothetical protein
MRQQRDGGIGGYCFPSIERCEALIIEGLPDCR